MPLDIEFLLESVLNETPEQVFSVQGDRVCLWSIQGVAFMIFDRFSIVGEGEQTHYDLIIAVKRIYDALHSQEKEGLSQETEIQIALDEINGAVSNMDEMKKEFDASRLKDFLDSGEWVNHKVYRDKIGLSGRMWPNKHIISFWNKSPDVIKRWDRVEKMFDEFIDLGKLEDYEVDWLERKPNATTGEYSPLTPASNISSSKNFAKADHLTGQKNFLKLLFASPRTLPALDPKEIEELQKKLHTLNPAQKKIALNIMGKKNVKAAEIANKLGITVAEFNHLMHQGLDETEDEKLPNMADLAIQLSKQ